MSTPASPVSRPSDAVTAYQRTAAVETAVALGLCSTGGAGATRRTAVTATV